MAKIDRESQARLDGMDYATRRIKEVGMEEWEKEYAWRNRNGITSTMTPKEIRKATDQISKFMLKYFLALTIATLHDTFDFGQVRLNRFKETFETGADYINKGYAHLQEYIDGIREQIGIDLDE